MMCLSQTSAYAVHALSCLDRKDGHASLIRDVASTTGIPKPYLAKIFNQLNHCGLITAKRGFHGGIALARPAANISILEIIEAIDGEHWIAECLLGVEDCRRSKVCPTHKAWGGMRKEIRNLLRRTTLADTIPFAGRATPAVKPALIPRRELRPARAPARVFGL